METVKKFSESIYNDRKKILSFSLVEGTPLAGCLFAIHTLGAATFAAAVCLPAAILIFNNFANIQE